MGGLAGCRGGGGVRFTWGAGRVSLRVGFEFGVGFSFVGSGLAASSMFGAFGWGSSFSLGSCSSWVIGGGCVRRGRGFLPTA